MTARRTRVLTISSYVVAIASLVILVGSLFTRAWLAAASAVLVITGAILNLRNIERQRGE